jgi:hypothetical protein
MWLKQFLSHSVRVGILSISIVLFSTASGRTETVSVDLNLTPPGSQNNLSLTLTAAYGALVRNDSDTTTATGNMIAELEATFDPLTHQIQEVTGLTFIGGTIHLSDVSFTLDYSFFGKIEAVGSGIGLTMVTPNPPGSVFGTIFDLAEHEAEFNQGIFHAEGFGIVGGLFDPIDLDLSAEPLTVTNEGNGTITVNLIDSDSRTATYEVQVQVPVDFDEVILDDPDNSILVTLQGSGTLEAVGHFTQCALSADLTGDCHVDSVDLMIFVAQWLDMGLPGNCPLSADLAGNDCQVDLLDFAVLASQWLK